MSRNFNLNFYDYYCRIWWLFWKTIRIIIRFIIGCISIVIFSVFFMLFVYPFTCTSEGGKPSLIKYIRYLKGIIFEGKKIPPNKPSNLFSDGAARLKWNPYFTEWANTQEYDSPVLYVTSTNYENTIKTANIPESVKEEIKDIVEGGDGVLISEVAFTPKWKYREKYVILEGFDHKPPKIKYMHKMMHRRFSLFLWLGLTQEGIRLGEYYRKYGSMKKPLLYPVVQVDKESKKELLPELDIPEEKKKDIEKLVDSNKIVIITEAAFQPEWKWEEKYLVFDEKKTRK